MYIFIEKTKLTGLRNMIMSKAIWRTAKAKTLKGIHKFWCHNSQIKINKQKITMILVRKVVTFFRTPFFPFVNKLLIIFKIWQWNIWYFTIRWFSNFIIQWSEIRESKPLRTGINLCISVAYIQIYPPPIRPIFFFFWKKRYAGKKKTF